MKKPTSKISADERDVSKLFIEMEARSEDERVLTEDGRDLIAVLMGRRGGLKGGKARAASLSAEKRTEIARKAAEKRWGKKDAQS